MISDDTFRKEFDSILKRQKLKKKERDTIINLYLSDDSTRRDNVLDVYEGISRDYEAQQAALKHIPSEFKEHTDTVDWFKREYPEIDIMLVRNHGSRTPREKQEQIMEGLLVGAADLFIPDLFCWVEMKRVKGGSQSDEQLRFQARREEAGYVYLLCLGFEDAKQKIIAFMQNKDSNL